MGKKRIELKISRTAEMTCLSRAASFLETDVHYHSEDHLAVSLLPGFVRALIHIPLCRRFFVHFLAPKGVYEYVIARTKYVDAAFQRALAEGFDQILLFGAGFDTRALRFHSEAGYTCIFELDSALTQKAKIRQYRKRHLSAPANVVFIAIDFEKESLPHRLDSAGFQKDRRTLFVLEGLLMYLAPESVQSTFQTIQRYTGSGSRVVFDYIQASVLRKENTLYGERRLAETVSRAGEQWQSGIEPDEIGAFAGAHGFEISDHQCARDLEATYFRGEDGRLVGRINGTHCVVTMERQRP